jgi:hypothetical protein
MGRIIPYMKWKNKTCVKPPARLNPMNPYESHIYAGYNSLHWPIDTWYMKAPHKSGTMNVDHDDHVPKVFPFVGLPLSHISKFTKEFRITHRPFLLVNSPFWLKNPTNITSGAVDGAPFLPVLFVGVLRPPWSLGPCCPRASQMPFDWSRRSSYPWNALCSEEWWGVEVTGGGPQKHGEFLTTNT